MAIIVVSRSLPMGPFCLAFHYVFPISISIAISSPCLHICIWLGSSLSYHWAPGPLRFTIGPPVGLSLSYHRVPGVTSIFAIGSPYLHSCISSSSLCFTIGSTLWNSICLTNGSLWVPPFLPYGPSFFLPLGSLYMHICISLGPPLFYHWVPPVPTGLPLGPPVLPSGPRISSILPLGLPVLSSVSSVGPFCSTIGFLGGYKSEMLTFEYSLTIVSPLKTMKLVPAVDTP